MLSLSAGRRSRACFVALVALGAPLSGVPARGRAVRACDVPYRRRRDDRRDVVRARVPSCARGHPRAHAPEIAPRLGTGRDAPGERRHRRARHRPSRPRRVPGERAGLRDDGAGRSGGAPLPVVAPRPDHAADRHRRRVDRRDARGAGGVRRPVDCESRAAVAVDRLSRLAHRRPRSASTARGPRCWSRATTTGMRSDPRATCRRRAAARASSSSSAVPDTGRRCSRATRISPGAWWNGSDVRCYDRGFGPGLHVSRDSLIFGVAGVFFGVVVGWIIGSQQAGPAAHPRAGGADRAAPAGPESAAGRAPRRTPRGGADGRRPIAIRATPARASSSRTSTTTRSDSRTRRGGTRRR